MDPAEVARRSIARVSFNWKNEESLNKKTPCEEIDMVITGVIVSVKDEQCLIVIDPSFFRDKRRFSFYVNLPEKDGKYGKAITVTSKQLIVHEEFIGFPVAKNNYIAPVIFETSPIAQADHVFAYLFSRELAISEAYCSGHVVAVSQPQNHMGVVFHDCPLHEYGHFGSPIFNQKGLAVGICYATQSRIHAWMVIFLQKQFGLVFEDWSVTYVCSKNVPSQEGGSSYPDANHEGDPNLQGASNPLASNLASASVQCALAMPLAPATSTDASNCPPPPRSCLGMDIDPGEVQHPASIPKGVVTLAYNRNASTTTTFSPGIILSSERGLDNEYTTLVLSFCKALYDKVHVYFEPKSKVEAEVCSSDSDFMIVRIKDQEFHEPITWSSRMRPGYVLVETVSIMAGTKLNAKSTASIIRSLTGLLGLYGGQITTRSCSAASATSCSILEGTENYFQLSCSFQDNFVTFRNIDLDKVDYECDCVISAPVFCLKGEFLGIVVSSGNWPDRKNGIYAEKVLSIIEDLMKLIDDGWSKDKLKWSRAQSV